MPRMSIWPHLWAAAPADVTPTGDQRAAFLRDLVASHVIALPAVVLTGHLRDASPMDLDDCAWAPMHPDGPLYLASDVHVEVFTHGPEPVRTPTPAHVRYAGADPAAVAAAMAEPVPDGLDIVVVLTGFAEPDGSQPDAGSGHRVALYATGNPVELHDERGAFLIDGAVRDVDPRLLDESIPADAVAQIEISETCMSRWFLYAYGRGGPFTLAEHAIPVFERHLGPDHQRGAWFS